jgi:hypothetical protein
MSIFIASDRSPGFSQIFVGINQSIRGPKKSFSRLQFGESRNAHAISQPLEGVDPPRCRRVFVRFADNKWLPIHSLGMSF